MKPPPQLTPALILAAALIIFGAIIGAVSTKAILEKARATDAWRP